MAKLGTKLRRFFYRLRHEYLSTNNIVVGIAIAICLWSTFGAISSMSRNLELKQKLQDKRIEAETIKLEVEKLELEQQYYQTDEYKELMARSKGNKKLEGETMVILPENSEKAKNRHHETKTVEKEEKSNFEQWLDLIF